MAKIPNKKKIDFIFYEILRIVENKKAKKKIEALRIPAYDFLFEPELFRIGRFF